MSEIKITTRAGKSNTEADTRAILFNGRKATPEGIASAYLFRLHGLTEWQAVIQTTDGREFLAENASPIKAAREAYGKLTADAAPVGPAAPVKPAPAPATPLAANVTVPATMFDPALTYYADGTRVVMRAAGVQKYGTCAGMTARGSVYAFQRVNWEDGGFDNVAPHVLSPAAPVIIVPHVPGLASYSLPDMSDNRAPWCEACPEGEENKATHVVHNADSDFARKYCAVCAINAISNGTAITTQAIMLGNTYALWDVATHDHAPASVMTPYGKRWIADNRAAELLVCARREAEADADGRADMARKLEEGGRLPLDELVTASMVLMGAQWAEKRASGLSRDDDRAAVLVFAEMAREAKREALRSERAEFKMRATVRRGVKPGARVMNTHRQWGPMDVTDMGIGPGPDVIVSVVFPDGVRDEFPEYDLAPLTVDMDAAHAEAQARGWGLDLPSVLAALTADVLTTHALEILPVGCPRTAHRLERNAWRAGRGLSLPAFPDMVPVVVELDVHTEADAYGSVMTVDLQYARSGAAALYGVRADGSFRIYMN